MKDLRVYTPLPEPIPISEQVWPAGTRPMVAIATLTYNHEQFINEALDSFLMQKTTFPVRICIFEDCSTDNTVAIIKEYTNRYPDLFFNFFQPVNTWGDIERRNKAKEPFNEAQNEAKYIALCEGDDYWADPLKLQKQVDFLEGNPEYVLAGHNASIIDGDGNILQMKKMPNLTTDTVFTQEDLKKGMFHLTLTLVFRNVSLSIPDELRKVKNGDKVLVSMLGRYGKGIYIENIEPAVYRVHRGGIWSMTDEYTKQQMSRETANALKNYYKDEKEVANYYKHKLSTTSRAIMRVLDSSENWRKYINNNLFFLNYNWNTAKLYHWKEFFKGNMLYWKNSFLK